MLALSPEHTPGPEISPPEENQGEKLPDNVIDERELFKKKIKTNESLRPFDKHFSAKEDE
jgi:hypothetical protein